MKKFFAMVLTAMLFAGMLTGCGGTEDGGPEGEGAAVFKIGGIGPLTGDAATYGIATYNGAQLAVDEINAMGGVQFELSFQDDEGDPEKAINAYNVLREWGVQIIYGCTTTAPCVTVAGETFNDRYFQITPSASSTSVTEGKDNVFQMCFTDPSQGRSAGEWVIASGVATKVAVLYDNSNDYSTGIAQAFVQTCEEGSIEIVAQVACNANTVDYTALLAECQSAGAEMVFMPIYYTPASRVLSQAKAMDYAPIFFGADGMDGILEMEGFDTSLAEGLMLMTPFNASSTDERVAAFVKNYTERFGVETLNQFAADGYDCVYAIYEAVQAGNITPDMSHEEICDKMIEQFVGKITIDGLTGSNISWQATGEVSKGAMVVEIQNGVYVEK